MSRRTLYDNFEWSYSQRTTLTLWPLSDLDLRSKSDRLSRRSIRFHKDLISRLWVILLTDTQTRTGENITSLETVIANWSTLKLLSIWCWLLIRTRRPSASPNRPVPTWADESDELVFGFSHRRGISNIAAARRALADMRFRHFLNQFSRTAAGRVFGGREGEGGRAAARLGVEWDNILHGWRAQTTTLSFGKADKRTTTSDGCLLCCWLLGGRTVLIDCDSLRPSHASATRR